MICKTVKELAGQELKDLTTRERGGNLMRDPTHNSNCPKKSLPTPQCPEKADGSNWTEDVIDLAIDPSLFGDEYCLNIRTWIVIETPNSV